MPTNRQGLFAVLTESPLTGEQMADVIGPIARGAGFTPSRWTFNTQEVLLQPQPLPEPAPGEPPVPPSGVRRRDYMVRGGPWEGFLITLTRETAATPLPELTVRRSLNAFRQNFLNGPDAYDDSVSGTAMFTSMRDALVPLGARWMRLAALTPTSAVSWDRGIPEPLVLEAAGGSSAETPPAASSGGGGGGIGLAVAGLAIIAGFYFYAEDKGSPMRPRRA